MKNKDRSNIKNLNRVLIWVFIIIALLSIPIALFRDDIATFFNKDETPTDTTPPAKALRVSGNKIEYGAGSDYTEITLRGVNVGDPFHITYETARAQNAANGFYPDYTNGFYPDYEYIADTINANAVRYVFLPKWLTLGDSVKQAAFEYLVKNVNMALDSNMFVIIDYHTVAYPDGYTESSGSSDLYSSDFDLALEFWDTVSKQGWDGRVLFELWNEPASNNYDYTNSESARNAHWKEVKVWWEELIRVIRDNGADNIIIAAADYWTGDLRGVKNSLIEGGNIAYAWHRYGRVGNNTVTNWETRLDGLYFVAPVLVTEWGYDIRPDSMHYSTKSDFADKFIPNILEKHSLHSFAWSCDPWYTPSMFPSSEAYLREYNEFGQAVLDYLQSCDQIRPDISNT
jgi:hypothetical protein